MLRPPYDISYLLRNSKISGKLGTSYGYVATAYSSHISFGDRTMPLAAAVRRPHDIKIIIPKLYGDLTATVRH